MFSFFKLPLELRDAIYALLLEDTDMVFSRIDGKAAKGVCSTQYFQANYLLVNKQMYDECTQFAWSNMHLSWLIVLGNEVNHRPVFPLLSLNTRMPARVLTNLRFLTVTFNICMIGLQDFNRIQEIDEFLKELPSLRYLQIKVLTDVESLSNLHSPSRIFSSADKFFESIPEPNGNVPIIERLLLVQCALFEQSRSYRWADRNEAFLIGDIWMSGSNKVVFCATPSDGPYTWNGFDLELFEDPVSWEQIMRTMKEIKQDA